MFAESIGLLVQASVSLVVEHLFCKLEGFIVDFVTPRSIPQHEEQTRKRVLPPNNMSKNLYQAVIASGARFPLQKKMEVVFESSHTCTLLLQSDRKDKGKPHVVRRAVFSQTVRAKPVDCQRYFQEFGATITLLLQRVFLATISSKRCAHTVGGFHR